MNYTLEVTINYADGREAYEDTLYSETANLPRMFEELHREIEADGKITSVVLTITMVRKR